MTLFTKRNCLLFHFSKVMLYKFSLKKYFLVISTYFVPRIQVLILNTDPEYNPGLSSETLPLGLQMRINCRCDRSVRGDVKKVVVLGGAHHKMPISPLPPSCGETTTFWGGNFLLLITHDTEK